MGVVTHVLGGLVPYTWMEEVRVSLSLPASHYVDHGMEGGGGGQSVRDGLALRFVVDCRWAAGSQKER